MGRDRNEPGALAMDEISAEFSTEELMDFLAGDARPCDADPAFKEQLRGELWKLVRRRYSQPGDD